MMKDEVLAALLRKNRAERLEWLLRLGAELTVAARTAYPADAHSGSVQQLVAFNELQHRIYGYRRRAETGDEWPIEQLVETLLLTAAHYGVERDLGWAVERSLQVLS